MNKNVLSIRYDGSGEAAEEIEYAEHAHVPHDVLVVMVGATAADGYMGYEWGRNDILAQFLREKEEKNPGLEQIAA